MDSTLSGTKHQVVKMIDTGKQQHKLKENIHPNVTMNGVHMKENHG